jgi:predicted DNA-binding transcriptional regulator AlpA
MLATKSRLNADEAADYCGISVPTLKRYRAAGNGPKFIRFSPHKILYDVHDLDAWIAASKQRSTKPRRRRPKGGGGGGS